MGKLTVDKWLLVTRHADLEVLDPAVLHEFGVLDRMRPRNEGTRVIERISYRKHLDIKRGGALGYT